MDYLNWPKNQVNEQQQQLFLKVVNIGLRFIAFVVIFWANPETQRTKRQASFILERVPIPFFFLHHLHSRCWTESSKFTESYFCPPIPHSVCVLVKRDVNTYVCVDFFKPQRSCMLNSLKVLGGLTLNPVRWRQLSQHWTCSAHIIIICIFYGKGRHVGGYQRVWITPRLSDHPLHPSCQLSLSLSLTVFLLVLLVFVLIITEVMRAGLNQWLMSLDEGADTKSLCDCYVTLELWWNVLGILTRVYGFVEKSLRRCEQETQSKISIKSNVWFLNKHCF